ncbi:hypothetical protein KPATCC21470_4078 [Kitasatospora purpeofusca]
MGRVARPNNRPATPGARVRCAPPAAVMGAPYGRSHRMTGRHRHRHSY